MFSLWRDKKAKKYNISGSDKQSGGVKEIIQKVPSPRQNRIYGTCMRFSFGRHFCDTFVKRTRMFISCLGWTEAGMTVEASLVLPLFLLFFVSLGSAIEMIRLHSNMELALYDVGRRMSIYGYALTDANNGKTADGETAGKIVEVLGEVTLTNLYVKNQVVQYLGRDYLQESPIVGGTGGLDFSESELLDEEGHMEIVVTYPVSPAVVNPVIRDFRMMNRYYGHVWNGYKLPGDGDPGVIYITENGSVYHEDRDCTHLSLSVRVITREAVASSRNNAGERYLTCDRCVREETVSDGEPVYVTGEGDCFHIIRECPGLKRTVYAVPETEKDNLRPCSRCASRNCK